MDTQANMRTYLYINIFKYKIHNCYAYHKLGWVADVKCS